MSYIKISDKDKKVVIDGWNDVSINFYDTSDADVTAEDVREGKIAYGPNGKIVGTAKIEEENNIM